MAENMDWLDDAPTDVELASLDAPDKRWPEQLATMIDVFVATLRRERLSDDRALHLAQQAVLALAKLEGGRQWYLPTGERLVKAVRDRRIFLEANRDNKEVLAKRYGMTVRRLEQIVAEQMATHVGRHQGKLFD